MAIRKQGKRREVEQNNSATTVVVQKKVKPLHLFLFAIVLISLEIRWVYHYLGPQHSTLELQKELSAWQAPLLLNGGSAESNNAGAADPSKSRSRPTPRADGTLNGHPIYYHDEKSSPEKMWSSMHCIGESFADPFFWRRKRLHLDLNWMTRSCHFQFMCLDTHENDFVVFFPKVYESPTEHHYHSSTVYSNASTTEGVSIGGINAKWGHDGIPRLEWFPRVSHEAPAEFYTLPSSVTFLPFHSLAAFNPGHLVWDDFLPIYTLLEIFGLDTSDPLLLRYVLPGEGLWAGCDWRKDRKKECDIMLKKFGPLVVSDPTRTLPFSTQHDIRLEWHQNQNKARYVCARNGLAGIGSLTDHGTNKAHGWADSDYETVYNAGRGGQLWRFRNFMMTNLGLKEDHSPPKPLVILFSEASTKLANRNVNFDPYVQAIQQAEDLPKNIEIKRVKMKDYTLKEQVEMVQETAIYVTVCGGGAVSATFLPRGSSLVVFYSHTGGIENNRPTGKPARLDWDYINNMAYTRAHWLPRPKQHILPPPHGMSSPPKELEVFVELIKHELEIIQIQHESWEKNNGVA